MTESLIKLDTLTKDMFKNVKSGEVSTELLDGNGVKIVIDSNGGVKIDQIVIQTVDDKLVEATILIKDAQETLATAKEDRATDAAIADANDAAAIVQSEAKEAAATVVSDAKDARIEQLTADLKTANAEIAQNKEDRK